MKKEGGKNFWHIWISKLSSTKLDWESSWIFLKECISGIQPITANNPPPISRVDKRCRRELLTPFWFQAFLDECPNFEFGLESKCNCFQWKKKRELLTYLNFQIFLNELWLGIKLILLDWRRQARNSVIDKSCQLPNKQHFKRDSMKR